MKKTLNKGVRNTLIALELVLIMCLGARCEDFMTLMLLYMVLIPMLLANSYVLHKYGNIYEERR